MNEPDHYTDRALDHLTRPRNAGTLAVDPSGTGADANPSCGDRTTITLAISDGRVQDVRFRTFGCTAAIASASVLTELAAGLAVEAAAQLEPADILNALGGLPARKEACALMAIGALRGALLDARVERQRDRAARVRRDERRRRLRARGRAPRGAGRGRRRRVDAPHARWGPSDAPRCCGTDEAGEDARRAAAHLGIPFYALDYAEVFGREVVDRFVRSYAAGETPNPCVACNGYVKFEALLGDVTRKFGASRLATGHYARVATDPSGRRRLLRARREQGPVVRALHARPAGARVARASRSGSSRTRARPGPSPRGSGCRMPRRPRAWTSASSAATTGTSCASARPRRSWPGRSSARTGASSARTPGSAASPSDSAPASAWRRASGSTSCAWSSSAARRSSGRGPRSPFGRTACATSGSPPVACRPPPSPARRGPPVPGHAACVTCPHVCGPWHRRARARRGRPRGARPGRSLLRRGRGHRRRRRGPADRGVAPGGLLHRCALPRIPAFHVALAPATLGLVLA